MIARTTALAIMTLATVPAALAVDGFRKLSGAQIAVTLGGMQFTDEVHWRQVYGKDGTLRSFDMGRKDVGRWRIRGNEICTDLGDDGDNNCFEVWLRGNRLVMQRDAEDKFPNEGILEKPTEARPAVSGRKP